MKRIVAQELVASPICPHNLKYHPVSGALIATGVIPGESVGHYVAVWRDKTTPPSQIYERERPCDEGTELAFSRDGKLALVASACKGERLYVYDAATFALLTTVPFSNRRIKRRLRGNRQVVLDFRRARFFARENAGNVGSDSRRLRLFKIMRRRDGTSRRIYRVAQRGDDKFLRVPYIERRLVASERRVVRRVPTLDCRRRRPFERRRARVERRDDVFF